MSQQIQFKKNHTQNSLKKKSRLYGQNLGKLFSLQT